MTRADSRSSGAVAVSASGSTSSSYCPRCASSSGMPPSMIADACRSSIRPSRSASSVAGYVRTSASPSPSHEAIVRSPTRRAHASSAMTSRSGIVSPNSRLPFAARRCATRSATSCNASAKSSARWACRRAMSMRFCSARLTRADSSAQWGSMQWGSMPRGSIPPDADASRNSTGPEGSGCGSMGYSRRRSTTSGGFGRLTHSSRMNGATATFRIEDSDEKRKPR